MKYKVNYDLDICCTSLQTKVIARYSDLVALFGEPEDDDEYKVSGCWTIEGPEGAVLTIYDWKSTSLYDDSLPTVREFRTSKQRHLFHIGGHNRMAALELLEYIVEQLSKRDAS